MLKIQLDGKTLLLDTLKEKKAKITNYREYFEDYVTPALYKRFDDIFKKQGAVSNFSRWQRLRLSTILEKKRKGFRPEILRRTDRSAKRTQGRIVMGESVYTQSRSHTRIWLGMACITRKAEVCRKEPWLRGSSPIRNSTTILKTACRSIYQRSDHKTWKRHLFSRYLRSH